MWSPEVLVIGLSLLLSSNPEKQSVRGQGTQDLMRRDELGCACDHAIASLQRQLQRVQRLLNPDSPRSCLEIRQADASAPTGEYSLKTISGRVLKKVYCEMGLNGGGYTFINPFDLPKLTDSELQAMFTDRENVLLRARKTDGSQLFGVLAQLHQYQAIPLKLNLHITHSAHNLARLGPANIHCELLPTNFSASPPDYKRGLRVNEIEITYVKCGDQAGPAYGYISLFPNFQEQQSAGILQSIIYPMYDEFVAQLKSAPSGRLMPEEYFMFMEMHQGACGLYVETDGRTSVRGISQASIGFR